MKAIRYSSCILMTAAAVFLWSSPAGATEPHIAAAINWLVSVQDATGLWNPESAAAIRDGAAVVEVLGGLNAESLAVSRGLGAIKGERSQSVDFLARTVSAAIIAEGFVQSSLRDSIANHQNNDGGWGYQKGYGSNVLETALAIKALRLATSNDTSGLGAGIAYLTSHQNADGGWAFILGDSSRVFYTAHALLTLALVRGEFAVTTSIQNGVTWLKTQVRGDHGFGTKSSNAAETGLAIAGIITNDPSSALLTPAVSYLYATQLPNGSWGDDVYGTTLAIYGLSHMGPDPAILASDLGLSIGSPMDSNVVNITATIRNLGPVSASNVIVRFFDGDPATDGIQIGTDQSISSLAAGAAISRSVSWNTLHLAGFHNIHVVVDPMNAIAEADEANNLAVRPVHVLTPPDLIIEPSDIVFIPATPVPSEAVTIQATIHNAGETAATAIPLQFWDGNPATGVPLLGAPYIIPSIPPGAAFALNLNMGGYFSNAGDFLISACVDMSNGIREISELNNCSGNTIHVGLATTSLSLVTGINLLGLPLQPPDTVTSFDLIGRIPNCREISGWDRAGQRWISVVSLEGGGISGEDFTVGVRDGFLARVTSAGSASFAGRAVIENLATGLKPGFNLVSVPTTDACYRGYTLIGDIPDCAQARSWDGASQAWQQATKSGTTYSGVNFPVVVGKGYLVQSPTVQEWTTHSCDTLPPPIRPDLTFAPDDLWLDPNPVQAGSANESIWIRLHNIGTATAIAPLVSIYKGDPAAGGQLLAQGNWPNVPANDSTGFYGWSGLTFSTPGAYEIYAVIDRLSAIVELDETNNQVHNTLTVTAAAASVIALDGPIAELTQAPILAPPAARYASAVLDLSTGYPRPSPSVAGSSSPTSPLGIKSLTGSTAMAASATTISNVQTSNHTSSSATVTWTTDAPADGFVHYGVGSVAEHSQTEDASGVYLHTVAISGLATGTGYRYEVVSNGAINDNGGLDYSFTSTASGAGTPLIVCGRVRHSDSSIAAGVQVSVRCKKGATLSHPLAALAAQDGNWLVNLGNLKNPSTNDVFQWATGDSLLVSVQAGPDGGGVTRTTIPAGAPVVNTGTLYLTSLCNCTNHADPEADGFPDVFDLYTMIGIMFSGYPDVIEPACPHVGRSDFNCDCSPDLFDVIAMIEYLFSGGPPPCRPCDSGNSCPR